MAILTWFKQKIKFIFTRNVSLEKLTLSIVLGITLGLFPIPGLTTAACAIGAAIISLNVPILMTINLLVTPIELAMIPIFFMASNYLGIYQLIYGSTSIPPTFDISSIIASIKADKLKAIQEFADIFLLSIISWIIFVPFASILLYYSLKPFVAKIMIKFKSKTVD